MYLPAQTRPFPLPRPFHSARIFTVVELTMVATLKTGGAKPEATVAEIFNAIKDVPPGAWLALADQPLRILVYGPDAVKVTDEAREKREECPIFVRLRKKK
jgi:hypothetical protein